MVFPLAAIRGLGHPDPAAGAGAAPGDGAVRAPGQEDNSRRLNPQPTLTLS